MNAVEAGRLRQMYDEGQNLGNARYKGRELTKAELRLIFPPAGRTHRPMPHRPLKLEYVQQSSKVRQAQRKWHILHGNSSIGAPTTYCGLRPGVSRPRYDSPAGKLCKDCQLKAAIHRLNS